jgi:hypothetical protein
MLDIGATRCSHGVSFIDADECKDCLRLEAAKLNMLIDFAGMIEALTDIDDSATRALAMTAIGRYLSMKLHNADDAPRVFNELAEILWRQLPCAPEERMTVQAMLLTELSFSAYTPPPAPVFKLSDGRMR